MAAVLDGFSRLPLAARAFRSEPSSEDMAALVRAATRRYGRAQEVVTDRGGQFEGEAFQRALHRLGIRHRWGRLGQRHSLRSSSASGARSSVAFASRSFVP